MDLPVYNVATNRFSGADGCRDWCGGAFLRYSRHQWAGLTNQLIFTMHAAFVGRFLHAVVHVQPLYSRDLAFKWTPERKLPFEEVFDWEAFRKGVAPACVVTTEIGGGAFHDYNEFQHPGTMGIHLETTQRLLRRVRRLHFVKPWAMTYVRTGQENAAMLRAWQRLRVRDSFAPVAEVATRVKKALQAKHGRFFALHLRLEKDWQKKGRRPVAPDTVARLLGAELKKRGPAALYVATAVSLTAPEAAPYLKALRGVGFDAIVSKDALDVQLPAPLAGAFDFGALVELPVFAEAELAAGSVVSTFFQMIYLQRAAAGRACLNMEAVDGGVDMSWMMGFPTAALVPPPVGTI